MRVLQSMNLGWDMRFVSAVVFALNGALVRTLLKIGGIMSMVACFDFGLDSLFVAGMVFAFNRRQVRTLVKVGGVGCSYDCQLERMPCVGQCLP